MLTPQGPASYRCARMSELQNALIAHGYTFSAGKSIYELCRYTMQRSIIILYHNGTVLLQGADLDTPRHLFSKLIEAPQPTLPF